MTLDIQKPCELGRSGFFLSKEAIQDFAAIRVGQLIEFSHATFSTELPAFSGMGRVVWKREQAQENLLAGCGIEFVYMADPERQKLLDYLKKNPIQEVIPSGRA